MAWPEDRNTVTDADVDAAIAGLAHVPGGGHVARLHLRICRDAEELRRLRSVLAKIADGYHRFTVPNSPTGRTNARALTKADMQRMARAATTPTDDSQ